MSFDQNYFKTSMLDMTAEYAKVVPGLTINDTDRPKLYKMMPDSIR